MFILSGPTLCISPITFYIKYQIISCSPALLSSPIVPFLACIFCKLCNEIAYLAIPRSTVVRRLHRFQAAKNKKISIKLRYEIIYIMYHEDFIRSILSFLFCFFVAPNLVSIHCSNVSLDILFRSKKLGDIFCMV